MTVDNEKPALPSPVPASNQGNTFEPPGSRRDSGRLFGNGQTVCDQEDREEAFAREERRKWGGF
jgi:hypothetical protein